MQIVTTICDRHNAKGSEPVEATNTVTLILNKRAVEFDPCAECFEELQGFLEPWFEIGRRPGKLVLPVPAPARNVTNGKSDARSRRSFSKEYMTEIAERCQAGDQSVREIAAEIDVAESVVRRWIKAHAEGRLVEGRTMKPDKGEKNGLVFCRYHDGDEDCMRDFERTQARAMHERSAHGLAFSALSEAAQKKIMKVHNAKVNSLVSA